jgi:hypothetical protein
MNVILVSHHGRPLPHSQYAENEYAALPVKSCILPCGAVYLRSAQMAPRSRTRQSVHCHCGGGGGAGGRVFGHNSC